MRKLNEWIKKEKSKQYINILYILETGPVTVLSPLQKIVKLFFLYKQTPETKNTYKMKVNK